MRFQDRTQAGQLLAGELAKYKGRSDVVVLALPRGGVPVGFEVAKALAAPLDVFLVRKLGVPGQEELAMGAIASGVRILKQDLVDFLGISGEVIDRVTARELQELKRREQLYRAGRPAIDAHGRTAILVDDGLATGSTMRAAAIALRNQVPARIVVAAPVASSSTVDELRGEVDETVCVFTSEPFHSISLWYADFSQTNDETVCELLAQSPEQSAAPAHRGAGAQ